MNPRLIEVKEAHSGDFVAGRPSFDLPGESPSEGPAAWNTEILRFSGISRGQWTQSFGGRSIPIEWLRNLQQAVSRFDDGNGRRWRPGLGAVRSAGGILSLKVPRPALWKACRARPSSAVLPSRIVSLSDLAGMCSRFGGGPFVLPAGVISSRKVAANGMDSFSRRRKS